MSLKEGKHWPYLLIALLVSGVAMNIAMVLRAAGDPSFAIEKDYYQKAVDWDASRALARESRALGWSMDVVPRFDEREGTGALVVGARLRDALGLLIPDASVEVEAVHIARSNRRFVAVMDHRDGVFQARLPTMRPGQWEFRFTAKRGDDVFLHTERSDVFPQAALQ